MEYNSNTGLDNSFNESDAFDDSLDGGESSNLSDDGGNYSYLGDDIDSANEALAFLGEVPEGLADEDRAIAASFFEDLDGRLAPEVGQELLTRYAEISEQQEHTQGVRDIAERDSALGALRSVWGSNFRSNMRDLRAAINSMPFAAELNDARLPDGKLLLNEPEVATWLHNLIKGTNMNQQRSPNRQAPIKPSGAAK